MKKSWKRQATDFVNVSHFQKTMQSALESMNWPHTTEAFVEDLFSVDFTLKGCSKPKVALEADGPTHFIKNTRQPMGPSLLRRRLLRKLGWTVVNVPYWEWDYSGEKGQQAIYLVKAVVAAGVKPPPDLTIPGLHQGAGRHQLPVGSAPEPLQRQRGQTIPARLSTSRSRDGRPGSRRAEPALSSRTRSPFQDVPLAKPMQMGAGRPPQPSIPGPADALADALGSDTANSNGSASTKEVSGQESKTSSKGNGEKNDLRRMLVDRRTRKKELHNMTVQNQLKPLLKEYGLLVRGKKSDLIERILDHEDARRAFNAIE